MKTETAYYMILSVYISLWTCQLIASHLTHSLIMLTDSYINLFKILDILLGIVHLRTQRQLARHKLMQQQTSRTELNDRHSKGQSVAGSLLNCVCSYDFKRLPLLGAFINGLFLIALLLSAAIEGIQTCIHVGHSEADSQTNILTQNPLTYPLTLIGFATVGFVMQYCTLKAHEMRDEELCSESLLELRQKKLVFVPLELNASQLTAKNLPKIDHHQGDERDCNNSIEPKRDAHKMTKSLQSLSGKRKRYDLNLISQLTRRHSEERQNYELPDSADELGKIQRISLRALDELDDQNFENNFSTPPNLLEENLANNQQHNDRYDRWFWVRNLSSPLALISCALIILFVNNNWFTEVSDATLAILVVISLFAASYPPMKSAGRVLLQTVPDGIKLVELKQKLQTANRYIREVKDLHVWSLTSRSNRVATCCLVLDPKQVTNREMVRQILDEAMFVFQSHNIKNTTIEPVFIGEHEEQVLESSAHCRHNLDVGHNCDSNKSPQCT